MIVKDGEKEIDITTDCEAGHHHQCDKLWCECKCHVRYYKS